MTYSENFQKMTLDLPESSAGSRGISSVDDNRRINENERVDQQQQTKNSKNSNVGGGKRGASDELGETLRDKKIIKQAEQNNETGDDRVTFDDPPAEPLINSANAPESTDLYQTITDRGTVERMDNSLNPTIQTRDLSPLRESDGRPSEDQEAALSHRPDQTSPPTSPSDPQEALMAELRRQRFSLTDLYHPYICPSDTSVQDARRRLETALEQTRRLRKLFTERVYGKYRVCLVPPPTLGQILDPIRQDPVAAHARLIEDMEQIRLEKEVEKREALQLNTDISRTKASTAQLGIDHAEQLMYMSAGLNLVILPEDEKVDPEMLKEYVDGRGPLLPSGQRNRAISLAAATSGDVVLDRTRKALAMRNERVRLGPAQISSGEIPASSHFIQVTAVATKKTETAALQDHSDVATEPMVRVPPTRFPAPEEVMPAPPTKQIPPAPTTETATKKSLSSNKQVRPRTSTSLSVSSLLSLHPHADQLDADERQTASTAALIANGVDPVAANSKSFTQWRLRHPHPESLGGRRRPSDLLKEQTINEGSEAIFDNSLPPLPTVQERRQRKPLGVLSVEEAASERAKKAIDTVLHPFKKEQTGCVSKVSLLHHMWKTYSKRVPEEKAGGESESGYNREPSPESDMNPMIAYLVMRSIGLLGKPDANQPAQRLESVLGDSQSSVRNKKMEEIRSELDARSSIFAERLNADNRKGLLQGHKQIIQPVGEVEGQTLSTKSSGDTFVVPVESIRGGGVPLGRCEANEESPSKQDNNPDPLLDQRKVDRTAFTGDSGVAWPSNTPPAQSNHGLPHGIVGMQNCSSPSPFISMQPPSVPSSLPGYLTPSELDHSASGLGTLPVAHQLQATGLLHAQGDIVGNNIAYVHTPTQRQDVFETFVHGTAGLSAHSPGAGGLAIQSQTVGDPRRKSLDQQPRALIHGANANYQHNLHFQHTSVLHPSAITVLSGGPNHYIAHNQYNLGVVQPAVGAQFPQALFPSASARDANHQDETGVTAIAFRDCVKPDDRLSDSRRKREPTGPKSSTTQDTVYSTKNSDDSSKASLFNEEKNALLLKTLNSGVAARAQESQQGEKRVIKNALNTSSELFPACLSESFITPDGGPSSRNDATSAEARIPSAPTVPNSRHNDAAGSKTDKTCTPKQDELVPSSNEDTKTSCLAQKAGNEPVWPLKGSTSRQGDAAGEVDKNREEQPSRLGKRNLPPVATAAEVGLKFTKPSPPLSLREAESTSIREGRFHEIVDALDENDVDRKKLAYEYLLSVGTAVPIPKALIANPLKEAMNSPNMKCLGTAPRDGILSVILVWLWANFEPSFQSAFQRSGRIDVDPDCKWLIHIGVELAVNELLTAASERSEGPHSQFAVARKTLVVQKQIVGQDILSEKHKISAGQVRVEIETAAVVARALMDELCVLEDCSVVLPNLQYCAAYLDEARLAALQAKALERTLLANIISRKATMTDSFSHAYVSALVRAGEALGHERLFKGVQNVARNISTMIPYDIITDGFDQWEDPCKPTGGISAGLTADGLTRRAHSRAMIQKSLRKLQDKYNIKGGALSMGPYADSGLTSAPKVSMGGKVPLASSPRPGLKRKYSASEPPVPPGTGSAKAPSWNVYNPRHLTESLEWSTSALENLPYGKHFISDRRRSLSLSFSARAGDSTKKSKKAKIQETKVNRPDEPKQDNEVGLPRSTLEIPWSDVADIFQRVELPKKSSSSRSSSSHHHESTPLPVDVEIFAPFCRKIGDIQDDSSESDSEEDISDATILNRHDVVLDYMKQKLSAYMEARRKLQERRRNRSKGRSKAM